MTSAVYSVPADFLQRFQREFRDYRIRWSRRRGTWQIEQQVGRGAALLPYRLDEDDDDLVRARDGYWIVLETQPGDRMPCPLCGLTLKVPVFSTAEVRCENCIRHKRDGRYLGGYYPFSERLLELLRHSDPQRDGVRRLMREADAMNQARLRAAERAHANQIEAATLEDYDRLVGIGKAAHDASQTRMWQ